MSCGSECTREAQKGVKMYIFDKTKIHHITHNTTVADQCGTLNVKRILIILHYKYELT